MAPLDDAGASVKAGEAAPEGPLGWDRQYGAWRDCSGVRLSLQLRREARHVASWLERHPCPDLVQLRRELHSQALALSIAADEVEEMEDRLWRATRPRPTGLRRVRARLRVLLLRLGNALA